MPCRIGEIHDEADGLGRSFTDAEWVDVSAARLLLDAAPSMVQGRRWDVWPKLCSALHLWKERRDAVRERLLGEDHSRWIKYTEASLKDLLGQLLRLRFAREKWLRKNFEELCAHYGVSSAVELSFMMYPLLTTRESESEEHGSVIYVGCTTASSRNYYMV